MKNLQLHEIEDDLGTVAEESGVDRATKGSSVLSIRLKQFSVDLSAARSRA